MWLFFILLLTIFIIKFIYLSINLNGWNFLFKLFIIETKHDFIDFINPNMPYILMIKWFFFFVLLL
jgi:hypothetical protein